MRVMWCWPTCGSQPKKPNPLNAEVYARYPEFFMMREIEVNEHILVAALLDPTAVSA